MLNHAWSGVAIIALSKGDETALAPTIWIDNPTFGPRAQFRGVGYPDLLYKLHRIALHVNVYSSIFRMRNSDVPNPDKRTSHAY